MLLEHRVLSSKYSPLIDYSRFFLNNENSNWKLPNKAELEIIVNFSIFMLSIITNADNFFLFPLFYKEQIHIYFIANAFNQANFSLTSVTKSVNLRHTQGMAMDSSNI